MTPAPSQNLELFAALVGQYFFGIRYSQISKGALLETDLRWHRAAVPLCRWSVVPRLGISCEFFDCEDWTCFARYSGETGRRKIEESDLRGEECYTSKKSRLAYHFR